MNAANGSTLVLFLVALVIGWAPGTLEGQDCNGNGIDDALDLLPTVAFNSPEFNEIDPSPRCVIAADLDGDGISDVVTGNAVPTLNVLFGDGAGGFRGGRLFASSASPTTKLEAVDMDDDGDLDLVGSSSTRPGIYFNDGTGGFPQRTVLEPGGSFPAAATAAHFDGDGLPDVIVLAATDPPGLLYRNLGGGDFEEAVPIADLDASSVSIGSADLDGDGLADLIASSGSSALTILNEGDAQFAEPAVHEVGGIAWDIVPADLDGDGDTDVALGLRDRVLFLLFNQGAGDFAPPVRVAERLPSFYLAGADVDLDGDFDLLSAHRNNSAVSVLFNDGRGSYSTARSLLRSVTFSPNAVAAGDLGAGGLPELLIAEDEGFVSVAANISTPPVSADENGDGVPDECELPEGDCDGNGLPDVCELAGRDCNRNGVLDDCDLLLGTLSDLDGNGIADLCEERRWFHRGDTNGDLDLTIVDAIALLGFKFLGDSPPSCMDAADANDDEEIDVTDAIVILGFLFLGAPALSAPGPPTAPCGIDLEPPGDPATLGCEVYPECR